MKFLKNLFLLFCYSKSIADQVFQSSCSICIQQLIQYSVNKIQDPDFIELFRTHFHDVNATQESATSVIKQYIQQEQVYIKNSKKNPANVQYTSRQIQEDVDSLKATKTTLEVSDDDDEDEFDDQMSDYGDEDDEQQEIVDKTYILKEINEDIKSSGATFLGLIKTKHSQFFNMNDDSVIVSTMNLFFPPYRGIVKCPNKQVETTNKFVVKYMRSQTNRAEIDFTDFLNQFQVEQLMLMSGFRFIFSNSATRQYFDQSQQQNNRILDQVIPDEIQNYLSYQDNQIPQTFSVFCPFLKLSDLIPDIPEYICAETVASDYFAIENANCWVVNGVQCYRILVNIFDLLLVKSSIDQMIPVHECQLFFTLKQPLQPVTVNADGSLNLGISGNHNPPFSLLIRGLQLVNGCYDEILQTVCDGNVESSIGFCQEMNIYVSVSKRNEIYSSLVPDNYVEAPIYLYNSTRFSILLPSICGISKEQWTKRKSYIGLYDIFQ